MEVQLETCNIMITSSKALAQGVSAITKGVRNKIPCMYNKMLFEMNSEDGETPANKISTQ